MHVNQLIYELMIDETGRKDACGQIKLTAEELAIFREAGVDEGSYHAGGLCSPSYWFIARETFYAGVERYPGEYMVQVLAARQAQARQHKSKHKRDISGV